MRVPRSFDVGVRRLAGVVFMLMALVWLGSAIQGARTRDLGLLGFAIASGSIFGALAWLYLWGPLSRPRADKP